METSRLVACPVPSRVYCVDMRRLVTSLRQILSTIIRYLPGGASSPRLAHEEAHEQQERADLAMLQILVQESERPHTDVSLSASPLEDDLHP